MLIRMLWPKARALGAVEELPTPTPHSSFSGAGRGLGAPGSLQGAVQHRSPTTFGPFLPSPAYICSNQIMGWGEKAIEIRSVETGHLDGVFMHKRAQRLKFLCERNDKVGPLER